MVKAGIGLGLFFLGFLIAWAGVNGKMGVSLAALVSPTQLVPAGEGCP